MQETQEMFDDIQFTHKGKEMFADVDVSVEWITVDDSFDHAFGREVIWNLEWDDYYIEHFTVYDEDGEILGEFNFSDYKVYDPQVFRKTCDTWKSYSSYLLDRIPHLLDELEPPEREYD
jgi:negative regulator of sigma E activity